MADNPFPLPVFYFRVGWGETVVEFSEVTGLNIEVQVLEYRDGSRKEFSTMKMPGIPKYGNITFKRGILPKKNDFFNWIKTSFQMDKVDRKTLTISLCDETGTGVITWTAIRAFPVKLEGPGLKSTGNEVAIESMEVAHEGLTISNE